MNFRNTVKIMNFSHFIYFHHCKLYYSYVINILYYNFCLVILLWKDLYTAKHVSCICLKRKKKPLEPSFELDLKDGSIFMIV